MKRTSEVSFVFRRPRSSSVQPGALPVPLRVLPPAKHKSIITSAAFATLRPPLPSIQPSFHLSRGH
ncbi:MAG: hypothetical protein ACTS7I_00820 [Candidatus Hodgkinia cicadicola]